VDEIRTIRFRYRTTAPSSCSFGRDPSAMSLASSDMLTTLTILVDGSETAMRQRRSGLRHVPTQPLLGKICMFTINETRPTLYLRPSLTLMSQDAARHHQADLAHPRYDSSDQRGGHGDQVEPAFDRRESEKAKADYCYPTSRQSDRQRSLPRWSGRERRPRA